MIDSLCDQAGKQNTTVACFYFDFAVQKEQSPASTVGALLKQVVGGLEEIPGEISQAYREQKKALGGRGPRLSDVVKMLQTTSSKERTFICIDALDECVPEHRIKLLDSLGQILQKSPGTKIFVTGRPHIEPEIRRRLTGRVTCLPICTKRADIIRYLHSRLKDDTTPDAMDSCLEADILRKIPEDLSEMYVEAATLGKIPRASANRYLSRFLLVSLNIDAILQEPTIHLRRQKLSAITDVSGLGGSYSATLDRIKGQGGEKARLGMAALMWISHVERSLNAEELCHALAVEIGSPNLNTGNVPSISTLLACCQGLVVVEKESSAVRLIHLTLQEYLRAHPDLFSPAHSTIAETCLTYLNSRQVKSFSISLSPDFQDTPFLEYASVYWGVHAKRDLSDRAKLLALKLFDDYNNHISTKILLGAQKRYCYALDFDKISLFSGLHCASFFGIVEIVTSLVEIESCDINQMDCGGGTPLVWACRNGHEGVVKVLLGRGNVIPDRADNNGESPLSGAAWGGHEGVVKLLLSRDDISPDEPDNMDLTPLHSAAWCGHEGVVKMLLGRDIDPDKPTNIGRTPLLCAAWSGHEGVVKTLLGREGVNPNKPDNMGLTPLHSAAWCGHEEVVKMLLTREGVKPDKPDNDGRSPLWSAASKGHEGVVKILLGRDDVNPDRPNSKEQTPLWGAAENGHEGVVKMLLEPQDVRPDKPDSIGRTPLFIAACHGHEGILKMLIGRDANPDKPNIHGRTPLYLASWNGQEGAVKILLGLADINPSKLDKDGKTPLDRATEEGHKGVIALLQPPQSAALNPT